MSFQTFRPSPALAPWVAFYWHADLPVPAGPDAERVLPDGGMQLIVNLRDAPMRVYDRDDVARVVATPSAIFTGPAERHGLISRSDTAQTIAIVALGATADNFLQDDARDVRDAVGQEVRLTCPRRPCPTAGPVSALTSSSTTPTQRSPS